MHFKSLLFSPSSNQKDIQASPINLSISPSFLIITSVILSNKLFIWETISLGAYRSQRPVNCAMSKKNIIAFLFSARGGKDNSLRTDFSSADWNEAFETYL